MKFMITTIMALLLMPTLRADTLTLRNNGELNGKVQYDEEAFTITARYSDQSITVSFDRKEVMTIEFNSRDYNPGRPHNDISVFEVTKGDTRDASDEEKRRPLPRKRHDQTADQKVPVFDDNSHPTQDLLQLRDHSQLNGRIMQLKNGVLLLKQGGKTRAIKVQQISSILVAPE